MESQRVKLLTEGYLRGWLKFEYVSNLSHFREELILDHIREERLYMLLHNKLAVETALVASNISRKKSHVDSLVAQLDAMIGLKLPSLAPKDKIKKDISGDDMQEWREILEKANKVKEESKIKKDSDA